MRNAVHHRVCSPDERALMSIVTLNSHKEYIMTTSNSIIAAIDALNVEVESHRAVIATAQDQIDKLLAARDTLGQLVTVEEAKPVRAAQKQQVTEESVDKPVHNEPAADDEVTVPRRSRRRRAEGEKMSPSEAGEALVESVVKQTRRERREAKVADATKRTVVATKAAARPKTLSDLRDKEAGKRKVTATKGKASTNGHKPNRKEQIAKLLKQGQTPREVADALGIAPNYVYHVKRGL